MADSTWLYRVGTEERGPVTTEELCRLLSERTIPLETLVWNSAINQWVAAGSIAGFRQAAGMTENPPADAVAETHGGEGDLSPAALPLPVATLDYASAVDGAFAPHPWVRFFARGVDLTVFTMTLMAVLLVLGFNPPLLFLFTPILWQVIEAWMLSSFGTTPGKAMMGVSVETVAGEKPTYGQALARAFSVWVFGQGLGIPGVSLITSILSYNRLTTEGTTTWDRNNNLRVRHAPCGVWRVIGSLFLAWAYSAVIFAAAIVVAVVTQLHTRRAVAAAPPAPTPSFVIPRPSSAVTFQPDDPGAPVISDPRQEELAGDWVIEVTRETNHHKLVLTNRLELDLDGTLRQSIRVMDPSGQPHPDQNQNWSGTWRLEGGKFVETVSTSSSAQHPQGTYTYTLANLTPVGFTVQRLSTPEGAPGSNAHPSYTFRRQ